MYVITVIPMMRAQFADELTYFSKASFQPGQLVEIPLRNQAIRALVVESTPVSEAKTAVRQADFQLKKITPQSETSALTKAYLDTIRRAADHYVTTPGRLLYDTMPQTIRDQGELPAAQEAITTQHQPVRPLILQAREQVRVEEYTKAIRHAFSRHGSVFLLTPTIQDAEHLATSLSKGIQDFTYLFHSGVPKRRLAERWQEALKSQHAIVALMTPGYLALPRPDIHTIIVDREAARSYKQPTRPFVDFRTLALWYAEALNAQCILADEPVRVETMHHYQSGRFESLRDIQTIVPYLPRTDLIDMRRDDEAASANRPHRVFHSVSEPVLESLRTTHAHGNHAFLFTARRGLAPITVCNDCGTRVSCHECGASVVLHRGSPEHIFVCHACGAIRSAHETCATCTSWRLTTLGVGTQLIERELARRLPEVPYFVLDRDTAKTARQAREIMNQFYSTPGSILLGTEMALGYINHPVETTGIISLDSLFSMPEWNIYERIYSILTRVQEVTKQTCFVQTRKPEEEILQFALKGHLGRFYQQELTDRKAFGYPPYATLIKLMIEGRPREVEQIAEECQNLLAPWQFSLLPKTFQTKPDLVAAHGFIRFTHPADGPKRLRRGEKRVTAPPPWPNPDLLTTLRSLPEQVTVEVDPYRIL